MAKAEKEKSAVSRPVKSEAISKSKISANQQIEKACETALNKLKGLNLEIPLQAEIQWCLGSYRQDRNPVGLYQMANRALKVFKAEQDKKTKGITAKLIGDLEKALKGM